MILSNRYQIIVSVFFQWVSTVDAVEGLCLRGADVDPSDETPSSSIEFDPQNMIGYEFIHNIEGHGYRAKVTDYFEHQKKFMISLGDGA